MLCVVGRPERGHPGWTNLQALQERCFQILSTTHCSCFCLHTGWTLFFQLSLPSFTWNDLPSPHSYPKCCEHFGRKCRGNVKHYFRNKISVAAKLLQSTASVRDISATSVFVCGRHTLFIIQDESPHKGA